MGATLALAEPTYTAPAITFETETAQADEAVWWVVFVGLAYAVALAWATYCRITGGYPDISFGWKGFKVACKSAP